MTQHNTNPDITVKRQRRRSLAMRIAPGGGVVVMIPHWLHEEHPKVRRFITDGLEKLRAHIPAERTSPLHDLTTIRVLVKTWAARMELHPGRVQFREMTRKWGSCSAKGSITLNSALVYLPWHLVEYVVVHELAHMHVFDHSPTFWRTLGQYLPDYETRKRELDGYIV